MHSASVGKLNSNLTTFSDKDKRAKFLGILLEKNYENASMM